MSTFIEPLPGLLDDPLLHLPDLPPLADVRIPPLRDPFPSRTLIPPLPLEPHADDQQLQGGIKLGGSKHASKSHLATSYIPPPDSPSGQRETKKPNIAISALVDSNSTETSSTDPSSTDHPPRGLPPCFVNLAAVENKSFSQLWLPKYPSLTRFKPDQDNQGDYVQLPKPPQQEASKPVPLLPIIINGIHEPPPSAALLPPMELEHVNALLQCISEPPSEEMAKPVDPGQQEGIVQHTSEPSHSVGEVGQATYQSACSSSEPHKKWRRWSHEETVQLLIAMEKWGIGYWKEMHADPAFNFGTRRPQDLKDRYRIISPGGLKRKRKGKGKKKGKENGEDPAEVKPATDTATASSSGSPQDNPIAHPQSSPTTVNPENFPFPIPPYKFRPRRGGRRFWSEAEHYNLMKGFARYGYQWTAIRNDSELDLANRKATDIRDKFRSLFPFEYIKAQSRPPVSKTRDDDDGEEDDGLAGTESWATVTLESLSESSACGSNSCDDLIPILDGDKHSPAPSQPTPTPTTTTTTATTTITTYPFNEGPRDSLENPVEFVTLQQQYPLQYLQQDPQLDQESGYTAAAMADGDGTESHRAAPFGNWE